MLLKCSSEKSMSSIDKIVIDNFFELIGHYCWYLEQSNIDYDQLGKDLVKRIVDMVDQGFLVKSV